MMKEFRGTLAS